MALSGKRLGITQKALYHEKFNGEAQFSIANQVFDVLFEREHNKENTEKIF